MNVDRDDEIVYRPAYGRLCLIAAVIGGWAAAAWMVLG